MFNIFGNIDPSKVLINFKKLKNEGKNEKAIDLLKKAIKKDSNSFDLAITACSFFAEIHKYKESAIYYKKTLSTFTSYKSQILDSLEDSFYRFNTPIELGQMIYEISIKDYSFENGLKILSSIPKDPLKILEKRLQDKYNNIYGYSESRQMGASDVIVHYQLSIYYNFIEKYNDAAFIIKQILEFAPDEITNIIELYEKLIRDRYNEPHLLLYLGEFHTINKDISKAARVLLKSILMSPNLKDIALKFLLSIEEKSPSPALELLLIDVYILSKNINEALKRLKKIPRGNKDILIVRYQKILKIDPKNSEANLALGDLYTEGESSIIPKEYEKVMESNPEKVAEIIERFGKITNLYNNPDNIYLLTKAYLIAEKYDDAVKTIKNGYFNNALTLHEAEDYIVEIIKKTGESDDILLLLAKIYTDKANNKKALILLEKLLSTNPQLLLDNKDKFEGKITPDSKFKIILSYAYASSGDIDTATMILENLIKSDELSPENILLCTDNAIRENSLPPEIAVAIFKSLETYYKDNYFPYYFAMAEAFYLTGKIDKMIEYLKKAEKINPENREIILDTIIDHISEGEKNETILNYVVNLSLGLEKIEHIEYLLNEYENIEIKDKENTYQIIKSIIDKYPDNIGFKRVYVGLLSKAKMYKQVIDETKLILMTTQGKESGYFFLKAGEAFIERNNVDVATQALIKALKYDPSLAEEEIPLLEEIRRILPNNYMILYTLGAAYSFNEDFQLASEIYYDIINRFPDKIDAIQNDIFNLLKKFNSSSFLHFISGFIHTKRNNLQEAVSEYESSFEINPEVGKKIIDQYDSLGKHNNPTIFISKGNILSHMGLNNEASDCLLKAFELDNTKVLPILNKLIEMRQDNPNNPEILYSLITIYMKSGQIDNSINLLKEIVEKEPTRANFVLDKLNNFLAQNPENIEIKYAILNIYLKIKDYKNSLVYINEIISKTDRYNEKLSIVLEGTNDINIEIVYFHILYALKQYSKIYSMIKVSINNRFRIDNKTLSEYLIKLEKELKFTNEDYLLLGKLLYYCKNYKQSEFYFNILLEKNPEKYDTLTIYLYKNLITQKIKNISILDEIKTKGFIKKEIYAALDDIKAELYKENIREIIQSQQEGSSVEMLNKLSYYYYLLNDFKTAIKYINYNTDNIEDEIERLYVLALIKEKLSKFEAINIYELMLSYNIKNKYISIVLERYSNLCKNIGYYENINKHRMLENISPHLGKYSYSLYKNSNSRIINAHINI